MIIKPGYIGLATIGGNKIRCNDFSINPAQDSLPYDHTIGLRDSQTNNLFSVKQDSGRRNPQRILWRPSVKSYQGNISHFLTNKSNNPLYSFARSGDDFEVDLKYTCGIGRKFEDCKVNSYTLTIDSGGYCEANAEIMSIKCDDTGGDSGDYIDEEKIITWDSVGISADGVGDIPINNFSFTINNNCRYIYTANSDNSLNPHKIRVGIQEVTGTISYFNKGENLTFLEHADQSKSITISFTDVGPITLNVIFKPQTRSSTLGPMISPIDFVGVGDALP